MAALREVKLPGSKDNIVDGLILSKLDVKEQSVLVELTLPEASETHERSLRFQIDRALKARDPHVSLHLEFKSKKSEKKADPSSCIATLIAVGSGKGGVGKSSVCVNLAFCFLKRGYRVGILDCDIYGPSIPTLLGVEGEKPMMLNGKIQPIEAHGIKLMSAGFLVEPGQSLVWRGPMIHKLIQQFTGDVDWGDLDLLLVDLPPGTGDAPLSLTQVMPLTGAVMVSLPQHLSLIDVHRGISMFSQVKVPVLGVVENMSHVECPKCGTKEEVFGPGRVREFCTQLGLTFLGGIPMSSKLRESCDRGQAFYLENEETPAGRSLMQIAERLMPFVRTLDEQEAATPLKISL